MTTEDDKDLAISAATSAACSIESIWQELDRLGRALVLPSEGTTATVTIARLKYDQELRDLRRHLDRLLEHLSPRPRRREKERVQ
jgi:hypothetical protein